MPSGDRQLGQTQVLYPGHPLVGRVVPIVRRYGQREWGQWVTELPDGSRQYIPISWCSPLMSFEETLPMSASSQDELSQEGPGPSFLSLEGLRNLAALVRRLQEETAQRGEEQQDGDGAPGEDPCQADAMGGGQYRAEGRDAGIAEVGELSPGVSPSPGECDPANGTSPGSSATGNQHPEQVSEP